MRFTRPRSGRETAQLAITVAACVGCASSPSPRAPRPSDAPPRPHAAGVALDPALSLPKATRTAPVEQGLVVLSEPADVRPVRRVVSDFFDAVVAEATDGLERVLERSAHVRTANKTRAEPAMPVWRRRFERLDYTALSSESVYRPSDVEIHTATDAAALGPARALPITPRSEEVVVRVPLAIGANTSKLFGPEIVFLMRGGPDGYKIGELYEDFRLP